MLTLKTRKTILNTVAIVFVLVGLYLLVFFAEHLPMLSACSSCILVFGAVLFFMFAYLFVWCQSYIE